jgi:hypothetical protein
MFAVIAADEVADPDTTMVLNVPFSHIKSDEQVVVRGFFVVEVHGVFSSVTGSA